MPAYHLQKEGSEYLINDTATLVQLACVGLVADQDRLRRVGEKRFRAAATFRELKEALKTDTWEAWEVLGDTDPESLWKQSVRWVGGKAPTENAPTASASKPSPRQTASQQPTPPTPPTPSAVSVASADSVKPPVAPVVAPSAPPVPPTPVSMPDESNVIVFPTPQPKPVRRIPSNAKPAPVFDRASHPAIVAAEMQMRAARPQKQFRAFPWIFGGVAFFGGILLWGVTFFVENTATWTSERPEGPPPEQVIAQAAEFEPDVPNPVAAPVPSDADALFFKKTEKIRSRLNRGVVEMQGRPDDLTNALMIEMSRMRVGLIKLKAPVHAWGGRNNDLPVAAEVHMVLKNQNDLIAQLGAAVLVVGKYLQAYELELTDFVVGLEDDSGIVQERHLSPEGVVAVFMNRKSMRELLLE